MGPGCGAADINTWVQDHQLPGDTPLLAYTFGNQTVVSFMCPDNVNSDKSDR